MTLICKGSDGVTYTGTADKSYNFEIYKGRPIKAVEGKNEGELFLDSTCTVGETKYTITYISAYSFYDTSFSFIRLPNTIKKLFGATFEGAKSLIRVDLSHTHIDTIDAFCFCTCNSLQYIDFPKTVKSFEKSSFLGCRSLKVLTIPPNIVTISTDETFTNTNITTLIYCGNKNIEYVFPSSVSNVYVSQKYTDTTFGGIPVTKPLYVCPLPINTCNYKNRKPYFISPLSFVSIISLVS